MSQLIITQPFSSRDAILAFITPPLAPTPPPPASRPALSTAVAMSRAKRRRSGRLHGRAAHRNQCDGAARRRADPHAGHPERVWGTHLQRARSSRAQRSTLSAGNPCRPVSRTPCRRRSLATRLVSWRWPSSHCDIAFSSQPISCCANTSNIVAWMAHVHLTNAVEFGKLGED